MYKKLILALFVFLFITGCSKKINEENPVDVVYNFILLCEEGKIAEAEKLLAPKNNLDYMDKFKEKNNGKDLFYIDYDYKGNDDVVELKFDYLKDQSSPTIAVVKLTSNYKKQNHIFEKNIVLHMIDTKWRIYDFLFMPVKVK
ncbi:hypothetical protein CE91St25_06380 [Campylobacter ureolyticus]|uniref:hypothetical protein n=1 Tax=Campylobacter ureolyticus TaxID=827 RepID=UPI001FC801D8|nr:hypothetical protein [Campylobacter ureolyticus]GKH60302.1 hypothetical protein CE91St25_06380 [Campylobacter ureolyticus]